MRAAAVVGGETPSRRSWPYRLTACLPLVFLIGAPSIFVTRAIFAAHYPSHFVNDSPTISETASLPPSSQFFEATMMLVTLCILTAWSLNLMRNARRLGEDAPLGLIALNWGSSLTGIAAGLFLALVAIFNLVDGHDMHMMSSWAFYIAQVLSITLDILFVLWMRRVPGRLAAQDSVRTRALVAAGIFIGSFFFLYMYLSKNYAPPERKYAIQIVYISAEYFVCLMCLAYPMTAYGEMRRDFREFADLDRLGAQV